MTCDVSIWTVEKGETTEIKMNNLILKIAKDRHYSTDPVVVAKMFADTFEDIPYIEGEKMNCEPQPETNETETNLEEYHKADFIQIPTYANWYYADTDEEVLISNSKIKNLVVSTSWDEIKKLSKLSNGKFGIELNRRYKGSINDNANKRIALYVIVTAYQKGVIP